MRSVAKCHNVNVLLIGAGMYARRTYIPQLAHQINNKDYKIVCGLDIFSQKDSIQAHFEHESIDIQMYYTSDTTISNTISETLEVQLRNIVETHKINSVIISTEPLAHFKYAKWALNSGLHVLMDKPITTEFHVISDEGKAKKLIEDYRILKDIYLFQLTNNPDLVFSLMAQRRFHPLFQFIKDLVSEVVVETNCPITSIQAFNCDGQWRFPTEIVEQSYHPYNQGYGKCSHSGYHFIDIVTWLFTQTCPENKFPDQLSVLSQGIYPEDLIEQLNLNDYRNLFDDFDKFNNYQESEYPKLFNNFGEVDAFNSLIFKKSGRKLAHIQLNLMHNGTSQRHFANSTGKDLYKGIGRIKHESYYIVQGPFQSILVETYQSQEDHKCTTATSTEFGDKSHLDVHVFRNSELFPQWKNHRKFDLNHISAKYRNRETSGIQEESRQNCINEFVGNIMHPTSRTNHASNLLDHELGVQTLSMIYQSLIAEKKGENGLITTSI
jgi:Oxidoreductase family, NAD-binding Rossmann fold